MTEFVLGVSASVAAAALVGFVVSGRSLWYRLKLRRLARGRRANVRSALSKSLGLDVPGIRRGLDRHRQEILSSSFRVERSGSVGGSDGTEVISGADALLQHVARAGGWVHLVKADTGFSKTTLGMTLSLISSYEGLTPLYIDLADAVREDPLREIEEILDRLETREGHLSGRPCFVIDAMNETIDPIRLCGRLASRRAEFEKLGAKFLFLFSHRHRAFPSRVHRALLTNGMGPIEEMELLFDPDEDVDLVFFHELLPRKVASADLNRELRTYCDRFARRSVSREDLTAYLIWRGSQSSPDPRCAPSPGSLRFDEIVNGGLIPGPFLYWICDLAFDLLRQESAVGRWPDAKSPGEAGLGEIRVWVTQSGLDRQLRGDDQYVEFQSETAVRVFAALSVARRLSMGTSPEELRGRTSYDACARFLQPAIRWTIANGSADADQAAAAIADLVSAELHGRDAPYSFYATALCGDVRSVFGERSDALDAELFEQMIVAIDEDRGQTCKESLEASGSGGHAPTLDPVLDQLFEVLTAYSRRAVSLLLRTMTDSVDPLVKSQAAYLLLGWLKEIRMPPHEQDQRALESIPTHLPEGQGNLHFRFHEVEILEKLVARFPFVPGLRAKAEAVAVGIAGAQPDLSCAPEIEGVYGSCQHLVSLRAECS